MSERCTPEVTGEAAEVASLLSKHVLKSTKQVIVINRGTIPKMRRGKEIAQGSHASMAWLTRRMEGELSFSVSGDGKPGLPGAIVLLSPAEKHWLESSFRKIVCYAESEDHLRMLMALARNHGVEAHLVTDAGSTEFDGVPTVTALAVGPDWEDRVDLVTSELPLY